MRRNRKVLSLLPPPPPIGRGLGWGCKIYPNSQSGNVFIIILVAVALFGALMFTFSRSGSQGVNSISKQEAKIAAQEILNYARLVEGAVDRVRRNGCSESEISFENAVVAGYTNPNAPPDKSCHIFEPEGGKISWNDFDFGDARYDTKHCVSLVGTDGINCGQTGAELFFYIIDLPTEICSQINTTLGYSFTDNIPPEENFSLSTGLPKFSGTFTAGNGSVGFLTVNGFQGKTSLCGTDNVGTFVGKNIFYHVLLAR